MLTGYLRQRRRTLLAFFLFGGIYYCANRGTVGGVRAKLVGGIVGEAQNYAVITGCYNVGDITGTSNVGGISGKVYVASAHLAVTAQVLSR